MFVQIARKLVLVSTTLVLMIETSNEANFKALEEFWLQRVPYIYYQAEFDKFSLKVFIDPDSKIKSMEASFV